MSELKRLQPTLVNVNKKEKKIDNEKQLAPSFRFELSLDDKNEKGYSEFTYSHLLKTFQKKRSKEFKNVEEKNTNGLDPFGDDDDEKLKEMAKRFEAKYGTVPTTKNKKKYDDDVDLGAGYDENDSFIDNTDAYDEVVPEGVTTALGGFYINSGPLEFSVKSTHQHSLEHRNSNASHNNSNNNEEESSDSSEDEVDNSNSRASKRKDTEVRLISSSDEVEAEENISEPSIKKAKLDETGEKKTNSEKNHNDNVIKKKKQNVDNLSRQQKNLDNKSEPMEIDGNLDNNQEEKKKSNCDISKVKDKKIDRIIKKPTSNGIEEKKLDNNKKIIFKDNNIDDAIESVVNDGKIDDESSRDTIDSTKSRCIAGTSSECEDIDKIDVRLPDNLPEDIKDVITKLKKQAETNKERKCKPLDSTINSPLFNLEKKLRLLDSAVTRSQVYAHLAHFLSCSKVTLANRAKKLCLQDAENRVKAPVERLKTVIDNEMPALIEKYNKECQRVSEEKNIEASLSDSSDNNDKKPEKSKIPRKKFIWNSESRKLISEIASVWRQYYRIRKPRKENMESFLTTFMENKILPLWPAGWMKTDVLLKYSNLELSVKRKQKKSNSVSTTSISNVRLETTNINNKFPKESDKTPTPPTNFVKDSVENSVSQTVKITASDPIVTATITTTTTTATTTITPSSSSSGERKLISSIKHRDKVRDNNPSQHDNQQSTIKSSSITTTAAATTTATPPPPMAKISLVPTAQLMAQKHVKNHDKFNPMDLTSSSLSITPVNDYQKSNKLIDDAKKDVISITSCSFGLPLNDESHSMNKSMNKYLSFSSNPLSSSSSSGGNVGMKIQSLKHRILQENIDGKLDDRLDDSEPQIIEQKDKKCDRWSDDKYKSHDINKKRRKEHKNTIESNQIVVPSVKSDILSQSQPKLSKEEQEQRQIEETMAATNFLSQIINEDPPRPTTTGGASGGGGASGVSSFTVANLTSNININDKRKESNLMVDDNIGNIIQTSEQEKDVQMVMRSLRELQELQEMKYSQNHSPLQKTKATNQFISGYSDDYPRHYHKKDEKLRLTKDEPQW